MINRNRRGAQSFANQLGLLFELKWPNGIVGNNLYFAAEPFAL